MEDNKNTALVPVEAQELTPAEKAQQAFAAMGTTLQELTAAFRKVGHAVVQAYREMADAALLIIESNREAFMWKLAYTWACTAQPEWVTIYHRTKKYRIRKKYYDRIMREYRAEKAREREAAIARIKRR